LRIEIASTRRLVDQSFKSIKSINWFAREFGGTFYITSATGRGITVEARVRTEPP
jgi:hypothetical protein